MDRAKKGKKDAQTKRWEIGRFHFPTHQRCRSPAPDHQIGAGQERKTGKSGKPRAGSSDPLHLRSCGPATEPQNPRIPKIQKNTKSPTWPPKKIPKKYQNGTSIAVLVPFWYFLGIFFRIFRGPSGGFCVFPCFRDSGVLGLCAGPQDRNPPCYGALGVTAAPSPYLNPLAA